MPLQRVEVFLEYFIGLLLQREGRLSYAYSHCGFHICPFFIFSIVPTSSVQAVFISWSCERPLSVME